MSVTGDGSPPPVGSPQLIECATRRLCYGVNVVSARCGDTVNAMTMRFVMQCSVRPPLLAIAMNKSRYTHGLVQQSRAFVVNVLGEGQEMLGGHFGLQSGRNVDKLAGIASEAGITTAPILKDCSAFMECRVVSAIDLGDFTLFIGEVINAGVRDRPPLSFRESDYFG